MATRFTIRQLEYFVAVGEAESIIKAAEQLNVSAPSISSAIAQLETELGLQLFVRRHSRGLTLTPGGRMVFREATRLLNMAESLRDVAADLAGTVRGQLTVGCFLTIAQILLPPLRMAFEQAYPEVRVRQFERNQGQLLDMLLGGEIDVALTYDMELSHDVSFETLVSVPAYVMLPRSHRMADRSQINIEELADEPMVLLDLPHSRDYFLSAFHNRGIRPNIRERASDVALMRSMVGNGFGYGIANMRPLNDFSPDGKPLVFLPLIGGPRPLSMGLALPNDTHRTQTLQAFIDHCRKFLAQPQGFTVV